MILEQLMSEVDHFGDGFVGDQAIEQSHLAVDIAHGGRRGVFGQKLR